MLPPLAATSLWCLLRGTRCLSVDCRFRPRSAATYCWLFTAAEVGAGTGILLPLGLFVEEEVLGSRCCYYCSCYWLREATPPPNFFFVALLLFDMKLLFSFSNRPELGA